MADAATDAAFDAFVARVSKQLDDGQFEPALEAAQSAARQWPDTFWPRYLMARCLAALGRRDEALRTYREVLDAHPGHPRAQEAREGVARLERTTEDRPEADADRERPPTPQASSASDSQLLYQATTRAAETGEYEISNRVAALAGAERPAPPPELMEYGETAQFHLASGRAHVEEMTSALESCGFRWESCRSVLEFGCSNGRLIRWLTDYAADREIWGVDIQADQVLWAAEHLSPPLNFATTTTAPHLPFPDYHFDLIFAGSVFTHLGELHVSWLLELARVLSPKGFLYLTVHDETFTSVVLADRTPRFKPIASRIRESGYAPALRSGDFDFISTAAYGEMMLSQVFMSSEYLEHLTRPFLRLEATFPRAYAKAQTGYVFAPRRRQGAPRRARARKTR